MTLAILSAWESPRENFLEAIVDIRVFLTEKVVCDPLGKNKCRMREACSRSLFVWVKQGLPRKRQFTRDKGGCEEGLTLSV